MSTNTLPKRLIAYLEGLTLTGRDHDGELLTLLPWERRFVRGAFGRPGDAALTVGRGNGKSALVAGIGTAVVDPSGPLHGRRQEVVAVASSFAQGWIIFEDALEFLRELHGGLSRRVWRWQDSANNALIQHKGSGARRAASGAIRRRCTVYGLRWSWRTSLRSGTGRRLTGRWRRLGPAWARFRDLA